MDVLLIPGALRSATNLAGWAERIPGLRLQSLPAHGGEPAIEWSLDAWIRHFQKFVSPETVVIGESLGGLVALGLGSKGIRGVIAIDPPLTTAKAWPVRLSLVDYAKKNPGRGADGLLSIFGYNQNGSIEDKIYYDYIRTSIAPTFIVTGDVPLHPQRSSAVPPCLVDDVDRYFLNNFTRARVYEIAGSHMLLDESPETCEFILKEILSILDD